MGVAENLLRVRESLPASVLLIAVSKTQPNKAIEEAYAAGQRAFGENKAQDLAAKAPELPQDIHWHFIGHLQTNKVKYIAPVVHTIHSVESLKLLQEINKRAAANGRVIRCLLQLRIAREETKFGMPLETAEALLNDPVLPSLDNVTFHGVMGMATFTEDRAQVRAEFQQLKGHFDHLKQRYFAADDAFCEVSMGMSGDYDLAVEEGSTMVRVGTAIFGPRNY